MTECGVAEGQCERESQCNVRGSWRLVSHVVDNALRAVSLADMLKPPVPPQIATVALSTLKSRTTA